MRKILPSESVFAFAAWLTCRKQSLTVGRHNDTAADMAVLADRWCKTNNIPPPRNGIYPDNIIQPDVDL